MWESNFDLDLQKKVPFIHVTWQLFWYIHYVHDVIFWKF
jgi:hypothetical protein